MFPTKTQISVACSAMEVVTCIPALLQITTTFLARELVFLMLIEIPIGFLGTKLAFFYENSKLSNVFYDGNCVFEGISSAGSCASKSNKRQHSSLNINVFLTSATTLFQAFKRHALQ